MTLDRIAELANCSASTVSRALRDSPLLSAATIARIRSVAETAGYRANPLLSSVMRRMRRGHSAAVCGNVAYLMAIAPGIDWTIHGTYRAFFQGAQQRAQALGLRLDQIVISEDHMRGRRLDEMLKARGHVGLIIGPWQGRPLGPDDLTWEQFSVVKVGSPLPHVALHRAGHHTLLAMTDALQICACRGYTRPGLALQAHQNRPGDQGWLAALSMYYTGNSGPAIPPFLPLCWDRVAFAKWYRKYRPDVVLSLRHEVVDWLQDLGTRVPEETGFVHLDRCTENTDATGIDQRPLEIGRSSINLLFDLLLDSPSPGSGHRHLLIEGCWVEGTTIRAPQKTGKTGDLVALPPPPPLSAARSRPMANSIPVSSSHSDGMCLVACGPARNSPAISRASGEAGKIATVTNVRASSPTANPAQRSK